MQRKSSCHAVQFAFLSGIRSSKNRRFRLISTSGQSLIGRQRPIRSPSGLWPPGEGPPDRPSHLVTWWGVFWSRTPNFPNLFEYTQIFHFKAFDVERSVLAVPPLLPSRLDMIIFWGLAWCSLDLPDGHGFSLGAPLLGHAFSLTRL